ncbi:Trafficking particle complex subunit 4 [Paramuricea clavata]|uniref:Trafficking protein particle complex subunit n=1 Tax=Paramuricea clavata TaxID=317549 RepID=A0A7D9HAN2_PARCT|nr:Trafficking particle complex subunit 4 [Paramuricea clavata]
MAIQSVFILNKAGGLIYHTDRYNSKNDVEKTFGYPLDIVLKEDDKLTVIFGERDGIKVGFSLLAVNGEELSNKQLPNGTDALDFLKDPNNYPVSLKFGRIKLKTNEKIMFASMFHTLFAISTKLSPEQKSSGIQVLETESFKLHCYQTATGVKFLVLTDPKQGPMDNFLKRFHELYTDYALKNPFYSLEMPIRCELFDTNLQKTMEQVERATTQYSNE